MPDLPRLLLLGPLEIVTPEGVPQPVPGDRARILLTELALARTQSLGSDSLVQAIWEEEPPGNPRGALQALVSRTRRLLPAGSLITSEHGYRLSGLTTDLAAAETVTDTAADSTLRHTLALWRGEPGEGLPEALAERVRTRADAAQRRLSRALALRLSASSATVDEAVELWRRLWDGSPYDDTIVEDLMRALAAAGRPAEALETYRRHREKLRDDLGADPGSAVATLHTELLRGQEPTVDSARRIGLRAAPAALIGRETDLQAVETLLAERKLVTVLGAGGLGKTRLAQEIAARRAAAEPGTDVIVLELAPLDTPEDVLPALANLLGLRGVHPGKPLNGQARLDVREQVLAALNERPVLLVLDNCEHLVAEAARLCADLLGRLTSLRVLTTSRAPLATPAETLHALEPLSVDRDGAAVRLFTARARSARPGALLPLDLVREVCARLDGSPLAIELAAARVRGMSVQELHSRLDDRFGLLRGGDRTAPARHRTLLAVIEWSWALLGPGARDLLPRLALFPDGFTVDAAEAVSSTQRQDEALEDLSELVEQSLVQLVERTGEPARYRLLETVREFGSARLGGTVTEVRAAMISWGAAFARSNHALAAAGDRQLELFTATRREADNLVVMLRWSVAAGDATAAASLFVCLGGHWVMRAAIDEFGGIVEEVAEVLVAAPRPTDLAEAERLASALAMIAVWGMAAAPRLGARARAALRRIRASVVELDPLARAHADLALAAHDPVRLGRITTGLSEHPDPRVAALALCLRIPELENSGRLEEALALGDRLEALTSRHGAGWPAGLIQTLLAQINVEAGRPAVALAVAQRATELMEPYGGLGLPREPADLDWTFGVAAAQVGDTARARKVLASLRAKGVQESEQRHRGRGEPGAWPGEGEPPMAAALALLIEAEIAAYAGDTETAVLRSGEAMADVVAAAGRPRDPRAWPMVVILGGAHLAELAALGRSDGTTAHHVRVTALVSLRLRPHGPDLPVLGLGILGLALWGAISARLSETEVATGWGLALALGARQDFLAARHDRVRAQLVRMLPEELIARAERERPAAASQELRAAMRTWLERIRT